MAEKTVDAPNNEKVTIEVDPLMDAAFQRTKAAQDANAAAGEAEHNRIDNAGSAAKAGYGGGSETPPMTKRVEGVEEAYERLGIKK